MLLSDSAQRPALSLPPRLRPLGRVLVLVVDMLAVGCLTLFYDVVVVATVFWVEGTYYDKSAHNPSETLCVMVIMGLVVGAFVAGSLLLNKKYYRALAVLVGLIPLALLAQFVHALSKGH